MAMFFGGSFVFGEGLDDEDTLPAQFSKQTGCSMKGIGFAQFGYGPHQNLRFLETELEKPYVVQLKPKFAALIVADFHAGRVLGNSLAMRLSPKYVLRDGELQYHGAFMSPGERTLVELMRRFTLIAWSSDRWWQSVGRDYELTTAIIVEMDRILRNRYQIPLVVVYWDRPATANQGRLIEYLRKTDLRIVQSSLIFAPGGAYQLHEFDNHPSAQAHRELAKALVRIYEGR